MSDAKPPFHFIATCSTISLQSYELARLDAAANLRRQLQELTDQWIEAEVEARLARWALEHRRRDPQIRFDEFVAIDCPTAPVKSLASHRRRRALVEALPDAPPITAHDVLALPASPPSSVSLGMLAPAAPPSAQSRAISRRSRWFGTDRLIRRRARRFARQISS
ncbi:MAG: hypothetical protein WAK91_02995 [Candidatus Acidiferrales bacterium]|jgi:hypothetical protein